MGPAPLQPDRFYIGKQRFRCNGACPTFTTDPRKRGTGTVIKPFPSVSNEFEHGASPHFSLAFSVCISTG